MSMSTISGIRDFFGSAEKDLKGLSSKNKSVEEKAKAAVSTVVKDVKAWASTSSGKAEIASVTKDLSQMGSLSSNSLSALIGIQGKDSRLSGAPVPAAED